jgi:hypothetical protein
LKKGTYTVDEKNATITSSTVTAKGDKTDGVLSKAKLLNPNRLEFFTTQGGGNEIHMVLKKTK